MEVVGKTKLQKTYFDVLGLCCPSEIPLIENVLKQLDGIKDYSILVPTKTLIVVHDSLVVSQIQIVKALNQARLEANIRVKGETNYKNERPSPYSIASGVLLLLSFLKYFYSPLQWLAVASVAVGIPPIVLKSAAALRNFTVDINILVLITVGGSLALQDYWEAGTIVFLFSISNWLESRASHKASAVMSSLVNVVPQRAVLAETGEEIDADEVKLNTILAVKAGEVIPIDGIIVEGSCEVDEKILTGESFPVPKQKDSTVWASTINLNGYISVKTTAVAEDCVVARMTKVVEEAQSNKSPTQRFIDKFAKYYTPAIVVISALVAIVPLAFHLHDKRKWYHLALVVLVSGCPCAILLSTPVAIFCALSKAATLGVLFKGAEHLENLAKIKIMAFDKTGTITRGEFQVVDFKSIHDDISFNQMLYWVSSIECKSSHPMAEALVDYARQNSIEARPDKVDDFENFPGEGIYGKINDDEIYIGNKKIALKAGCSKVPNLEGYDMEGKSIGYIFMRSSLIGVFSLSDMCRTGAKEAINDLKSMGIRTVMLTGDCQGAANRAQNQLDGALDLVRAELLPEGKAQEITELQKDGPTAMIGDGLNDAPALATADIGISMGVSGSALATETGDIILMSIDLQKIPKSHNLAKKAQRKIYENVAISFSTKAGILGLAIAGHPLVWAAVLVDVGTCLLVIFNSMLLLKGSRSLQGKVECQRLKNQEDKFRCSDIEAQKKCEDKSCVSKNCTSSNARKVSCADDKCCDSLNSRAGSCADGKKCCDSLNSRAGSCADDKKCCNPSNSRNVSSAHDKKCFDSNSRVGSCADAKKSCDPFNARAGCCADVKRSCDPSNSMPVSCADDKKCCNSNSRVGSCAEDKKSCGPSNARAGCCADVKKSCDPSNSRAVSCADDKKCCNLNSRAGCCADDKKCCDPSNSRAGSCADDKKCCDFLNARADSHADDKKCCSSPNARAGSRADDKKCCNSSNARADSHADDKKCCSSPNARAGSRADDKKCCNSNSIVGSCADDKKCCNPLNSQSDSCADDKKCCDPLNSRSVSCADDKKCSSNANKDSNCHARDRITSQGCCQENRSLNHAKDIEVEIITLKNCDNKCCRDEEPKKSCASKRFNSSDSTAGCCSDHKKCCSTNKKDTTEDLQLLSHEDAEEIVTLENRPNKCCGNISRNKTDGVEQHGSGHCGRVGSRQGSKKTQSGGCCESYRRECCGRNGDSLTKLSEIVIEQ